MPIDYKKYPANWKQIRIDILNRAHNKCENCGVRNHSLGARDFEGNWHDENSIDHMNSSEGFSLFEDGYPQMIRIVLTIAHLDQDINNNDPSNLKALCQKCHFAHDRADNKVKSHQTRMNKKQQPEFKFEGL